MINNTSPEINPLYLQPVQIQNGVENNATLNFDENIFSTNPFAQDCSVNLKQTNYNDARHALKYGGNELNEGIKTFADLLTNGYECYNPDGTFKPEADKYFKFLAKENQAILNNYGSVDENSNTEDIIEAFMKLAVYGHTAENEISIIDLEKFMNSIETDSIEDDSLEYVNQEEVEEFTDIDDKTEDKDEDSLIEEIYTDTMDDIQDAKYTTETIDMNKYWYKGNSMTHSKAAELLEADIASHYGISKDDADYEAKLDKALDDIIDKNGDKIKLGDNQDKLEAILYIGNDGKNNDDLYISKIDNSSDELDIIESDSLEEETTSDIDTDETKDETKEETDNVEENKEDTQDTVKTDEIPTQDEDEVKISQDNYGTVKKYVKHGSPDWEMYYDYNNDGIYDEVESVKDKKLTHEILNVDNSIDAFKQGAVGDCWLLAMLKSISSSDMGTNNLDKVFKDNNDGTYTISFLGVGKDITVSLDELSEARTRGDFSTGDPTVLLYEYATNKLLYDIAKNPKEYNVQKLQQYAGSLVTPLLNRNDISEDDVLLNGSYSHSLTYLLFGGHTNFKYDVSYLKTYDAMGKAGVISFGRLNANSAASSFEGLMVKDENGKYCQLLTQHSYAIVDNDGTYVTIVNPHLGSIECKLKIEDLERYSSGVNIEYYRLQDIDTKTT